MNIMLLIDYTKPIEGFMDKLTFGGMMLGLGMATVFSVLIILLFTLVLFRFFFHNTGTKSNSEEKTVKQEQSVTTQIVNNGTDEEIAAVIAAAIAMAESESDGLKFRVVSFKSR